MVDREELIKLPKDALKEMALKKGVILASRQGIDILNSRIKDTLDEIDDVRRRMGEAAKDDSDLPENLEFKELKTQLQFQLPRKLNELRETESKTILFEENDPGKICFGTKFEAEMQYPDDRERAIFILLGPIEAAEKAEQRDTVVISYLSPLGQALWGKDLVVGKKYNFDTPGGQVKCTIKSTNPH